MEELVLEAINKFNLLKDVKHVTVALSGGADSVSLLYALNSLKNMLGIELSAAHFNHMIRGTEADRDEQFSKDICAKLGIEYKSERGDVPSYATEHHMSTELAAREMRYEFLSRINKGVVATAHTASDNLETMIFNLTRGASLKGLSGIPPKRDIFIRPIILCTRDDVENYCLKNNLSYVTDSTNLSDDYSRNRIRHQVVPLLKTINKSVERNASRTAFSLREDNNYIEKCCSTLYNKSKIKDNTIDLTFINNEDPSVLKRIIKKMLQKNNIESLDNFHINGVYNICICGGRISLPNNKTAISKNNILKIEDNCKSLQNINNYTVEIIETENKFFEKLKKVNNLFLKNFIDCDKIVGKSVVRTRLPGDSIRLKNRGATKSLKKLYNECHIPVEQREVLPVISDDLGVIWIYGIGVAERCAISATSKNVFRIYTTENKSI